MAERNVKILLIGNSEYPIYARAFYDCWKSAGYEIEFVRTDEYFNKLLLGNPVLQLIGKAEFKYCIGDVIWKLNRSVLKIADRFKPDFVFLYTTRHIYPKTIQKLKRNGIKIFVYCNDNPFAKYFPSYFWRYYKRLLCYADVGFVFRHSNIQDYLDAGCKRVEVLRSYYIKERNYYIENPKIKVPKVLFLGHYEDDGRAGYIKGLLDEKIEVGIFKAGWEKLEVGNPYLIRLENTFESSYNEMLNAADIAIVFLSQINKDTYTTRCFEIPMTKTLMVAPYNDDLASMFQEDKEIVFYRNKDEFVNKVKYYLGHEEERMKIAEAGYDRVVQDGHEAMDRVNFIMDLYKQISGSAEA